MGKGVTIEIMGQGLTTGTTGQGLTTVQGLTIMTTNKVEDRLPAKLLGASRTYEAITGSGT